MVLDDIRMSPLPGLRKRQNINFAAPGLPGMDGGLEAPPPSSSSHHHHPSSSSRRHDRRHDGPPSYAHHRSYRDTRPPRSTMTNVTQKRRVFQGIRQRMSTMQKSLPKIQDVNKIDRYSRLCFPLIFFICNLVYFCFYIFVG